MIIPLTRSHDDATAERFKKDPEFAGEYLAAVIKDNDVEEISQAIQVLKRALSRGIRENTND